MLARMPEGGGSLLDGFVPTSQIRARIARGMSEFKSASRATDVLENTISISKRKNAMIARDVGELRKRREEQSTLISKAENRLFQQAKEVSETEDKISSLEIELMEIEASRQKLESELLLREDTVGESELVLSLYTGIYESTGKYWQ